MTNKIVTLHTSNTGEQKSPPSNLQDFILWTQALLDKVPDNYKDTATVVFDVEQDYDSSYTVLEISYTCPMSEEELLLEKKRAETEAALDRARGLRQLAILKEKYGDQA